MNWPYPIDTMTISTPVYPKIVHVFDHIHPFGGMTIAFSPVDYKRSTIMVDCAIAVCSSKDRFDKAIGRQLALDRFASGNIFQLPLLMAVDYRDLPGKVKYVFSNLYFNSIDYQYY